LSVGIAFERGVEGSRGSFRRHADSGSSLDAVWEERLAAVFTMPAFSGSLHFALEILVMNGGLVALRSR